MTKGLPASGKSTWAREMQSKDPNIVRVNKDDLRAMLHNGKWSKFNEKQVLAVRDQIIVNALVDGRNVIVDDTNLAEKHFETLKEIAKKHTAQVEVVDFTSVSVDECVARDAKRANSVGEKVIRDMSVRFLGGKKAVSQPLNPVVFDDSLPYCVIFDLDGTLACIGDRSPYDSKACAGDLPNESIIRLFKTIASSVMYSTEMIIFSGRKDNAEIETRDWLENQEIIAYQLHMRRVDDDRKDSIVKQEMFDAYVRGKYNVLFVVDDRDQVVKMWRDQGITCLQVNYGDF